MSKYDYNLIVIGAGSAGLVSSYIAAAVKSKVALIEKHKMGGDCLNYGCVPSKAIIQSAKILSYAKNSTDFGIKKMNYEDCYVRPIAWRGSQQMGISTAKSDINVAIAVWNDWASYFKIEDRKAGLRLITSPWKRPSPDTAPCEAKASGPYVICTMSKEFAEEKGYHDALMLDYRGYVAEGTGANIFFIKGKEIHTPIPDCFLNGITRQTVIEMVKEQGFNITERHIKPEEISNFDEAFLTGTAAEITPIQSIDDIKFNTGDNTQNFKFMQDYHEIVRS